MERVKPTLSRPTTGNSTPRSLKSKKSFLGANLEKVTTAQSYDDHAHYRRHSDPHHHEPTEEAEKIESHESQETGSEDDHSSVDEGEKNTDLEKGPTEPEPPRPPEDPFLVTWDGPDDPSNPRNWSMKKKWLITVIVSLFTLLSPTSSSMVAPALTQMDKELGIGSEIESAMVLSIFVLAYAIGPLFLGPLSELYGRTIILQLTNAWYILFNFACGWSTNTAQILVFRFLAGLGGSAPLAIGGAVLGDLFIPEHRAKAVSLYSLAPLLGPAIGPIAGGYISANTTWRWIFWATSAFCVGIQILGIIFLKETYVPVLLQRKARQLRKTTGNTAYHTTYDSPDRSVPKVIGGALIRPFRMLVTQPIIQCIALYMAFLYGMMYLTLTSFPALWTEKYHQSTSTGSLNYIAQGVGFFLGAQVSAPLNDKVYVALKKRNNGVGRPEFRVPAMAVGSVLIPIGLILYGWSAEKVTHWIVPDIGAAIFSAGAICGFQSMQTYIIDSYTRYAASGIAAAVVMRSLCGFGFPLFGQALFNALGYGWGNTLLAFLGLLIGVPAPIAFWVYGERLRGKSKYASG